MELPLADCPRRFVGFDQRVEDEPVRPRRLDHVGLPVLQRRVNAVALGQGGAEAVAIVVVAQAEVDRQPGRAQRGEQLEEGRVVAALAGTEGEVAVDRRGGGAGREACHFGDHLAQVFGHRHLPQHRGRVGGDVDVGE